ncbi:spore coat protein GerQ [Bacillus salipaludis]|uniref:Spore coat protein GerQ n=1 Tax=Bacillus salipaludis TaxID=2547811 RepID=A0A4R5VXI6_9BACI|nr:spore coat protein GerQ [Bacillus salipaludis]MDQ6595228.1 spore coat protein GerQ [Bacillus salipaludis]TDK63923.1 spore coat protein GerQ [Bacillus salipaludis]
MSQYYPQGFQPYTGAAGQPGAQPQQQAFFPQTGVTSFPPAGTGGGLTPTPGGPGTSLPGQLPIEQSYIENILRLNKGKLVTVYATFEGNSQWNAKTFKGIIEAAGRDHVILSDPQSGARFLIPMVAVDYITFSEEIEYEYPFGSGPNLGTYPPR